MGSLSLVSTAAVITTAPATAITSSAPAALVPPALPRLPQLRGLPPAAEARVSQQHLFRHRFLVCRDVLIRLPIDAVKVGASPTPKPQPPNLQNPDQSPNRETALCQIPLHPPPHPTPPHLRCSEPSLASSPSPDASILRSRRSNTPFSHTWRTHFSHMSECLFFFEAFRPRHKLRWSEEARRMLETPNAGGTSQLSEALSLEFLARSFGARLVKTETELSYSSGSKITDYAVSLFGTHLVGVSVTRAVKWQGHGGLPQGHCALPKQLVTKELGFGILNEEEASALLYKKLYAINVSSRNVRNLRWNKQLLHVWVRSYKESQVLQEAYERMPPDLKANTVVLLTLCKGIEWIW